MSITTETVPGSNMTAEEIRNEVMQHLALNKTSASLAFLNSDEATKKGSNAQQALANVFFQHHADEMRLGHMIGADGDDNLTVPTWHAIMTSKDTFKEYLRHLTAVFVGDVDMPEDAASNVASDIINARKAKVKMCRDALTLHRSLHFMNGEALKAAQAELARADAAKLYPSWRYEAFSPAEDFKPYVGCYRVSPLLCLPKDATPTGHTATDIAMSEEYDLSSGASVVFKRKGKTATTEARVSIATVNAAYRSYHPAAKTTAELKAEKAGKAGADSKDAHGEGADFPPVTELLVEIGKQLKADGAPYYRDDFAGAAWDALDALVKLRNTLLSDEFAKRPDVAPEPEAPTPEADKPTPEAPEAPAEDTTPQTEAPAAKPAPKSRNKAA